MSNIFIVEDEENIRELVYYALKSEGYKVLAFEGARTFWKHILLEKPSLIILDIMMPEESGLDILRTLKKSKDTAHIPVILLTAIQAEENRIEGLDAGADDYITKPFSVDELLARVRAVLRRSGGTQKAPQGDSFNQHGLYLDPKKRVVLVQNAEVGLTFLEFELLHCLLRHQDMAMSRDQLLDLVWKPDEEGGPSDRNVDMQVRALRKKLGPCGELIKTVRGIGYKFKGNKNA